MIEQPASYTYLDIIVTAAADELCSVTMESAAGGLRSTFESPVPLPRIVEVVEDLESNRRLRESLESSKEQSGHRRSGWIGQSGVHPSLP